MKNYFLSTAFALLTIGSFYSCKEAKEETKTTEAKEVMVTPETFNTFKLDTEASSIHWKGFKPTGTHEGTISFSKGKLSVSENTVSAAKVAIDMKSINVTDLEAGDGKEDLEAHLKGTVKGEEDHFFNVEKFPIGKFEATNFTTTDGKTILSGNLTLKDITHNIEVPVSFKTDGQTIKITSETFSIDRTKWNVNYASKSVFEDLGEKFINDEIELTFTLIAHINK